MNSSHEPPADEDSPVCRLRIELLTAAKGQTNTATRQPSLPSTPPPQPIPQPPQPSDLLTPPEEAFLPSRYRATIHEPKLRDRAPKVEAVSQPSDSAAWKSPTNLLPPSSQPQSQVSSPLTPTPGKNKRLRSRFSRNRPLTKPLLKSSRSPSPKFTPLEQNQIKTCDTFLRPQAPQDDLRLMEDMRDMRVTAALADRRWRSQVAANELLRGGPQAQGGRGRQECPEYVFIAGEAHVFEHMMGSNNVREPKTMSDAELVKMLDRESR